MFCVCLVVVVVPCVVVVVFEMGGWTEGRSTPKSKRALLLINFTSCITPLLHAR